MNANKSGTQAYKNLYNSSLSPQHSAILQAEIPLFECINSRIIYNDFTIHGLWDVRVIERLRQVSMRIDHEIRWYRGQNAYVRFTYVGKGRCYGYIPDDELYHNRVMLSTLMGTNASFNILRHHSSNGFIGRERVIKELMLVRDLTHDWVVSNPNKEVVFRSKEREEADDYKNSHKEEKLNVSFGKSGPIQRIIDQHRHLWWFQPEWKNIELPKIKEIVADRFQETERKNLQEQVFEIVPGLKTLVNDPKFASLLNEAAKKEVTNPLPDDTNPDDTNVDQAADSKQGGQDAIIKPGTSIDELKVSEIRKIASRDFKITNVNKKGKDALVEEIKEKMGVKNDDNNDENDVDAETFDLSKTDNE